MGNLPGKFPSVKALDVEICTPESQGVATRKKRDPGIYAASGAILAAALASHKPEPMSRKQFADAIGAKGGERTVTHWILGDTWPRERELRARMRTVLRPHVVDAIENEVAKVLGLPWLEPHEQDLLNAYRTGAFDTINAALDKWRRGERKAKP